MSTHIPDPNDQVRVFAHQRDSGQLVGFTYPTRNERTVTVLGEDPLLGPSHYLVERSDGAMWGVRAERLERLWEQLQPQEETNVSIQANQDLG